MVQAALPSRPDRRPLGVLLVEAERVTPEQLAEALAVQHLEDERVGEALVRLHHCTEQEVCAALGRQFGLPILKSLAESDIDDELVEQVPIGFARANMCLPWKVDREMDEVHVISADPLYSTVFKNA